MKQLTHLKFNIMKVTDLKENECIHCETEEQAKLFLKNFEEQLEQIKEFL